MDNEDTPVPRVTLMSYTRELEKLEQPVLNGSLRRVAIAVGVAVCVVLLAYVAWML